jgi:hypothetical protein
MILGLISLVFIGFVCIFIFMQIRVYINHKNKRTYTLNSDKKSKHESFLIRDTTDPSILQVNNYKFW